MARLFLALSLLLLPPVIAAGQSPPDSGDVVINEIMYAPSPSANEYIELYNRSSSAVNLGELEFGDSNQDFDPVASTDSLLQPDQYAVLVRDTAAFSSVFPSIPFLAPDGWEGLNNGGDTVFLRHAPSATMLDSVSYDPSWGGSDGNALERIDPAGPSTRASNFGTSEADAGGTPGARNSIYDPDETPPSLERVTPSPNGTSLIARFSEPVARPSVSPSEFTIDDANAPAVDQARVSDTAATQILVDLASRLSPGSFTLIANNVSDRQGNVRNETEASFRYFVPATPAPKDLVVSEILYAPAPASNEFIEIYNRSDSTVNLGALEYADEERNFNSITSGLTPIAPDSHVVLVRDSAAFQMAFPNIRYQAPAGWDALNNGGDTVLLRHAPSATVIDSVPYDPSWGGSDGRSLERIDPAGPSDAASNFASSTARAGGTPGRRNSRYNPDEAAPTPVFAEQTAERQVVVTFSEPVQASSVTPSAFTVPETVITAATLTKDTLAVLSLQNSPSGSSIELEGVVDRVGNVMMETTIPLAYRPEEGSVVVNEILFDPRADDFDQRPNQVEYVELLSRADRPLSLNGLTLTDRPTERGVADTLHIGQRTALLPNGYGVIAAAPAGRQSLDSTQLAVAFPQAPLATDSVSFLPVNAQRLGLGNDGDLVRLHRADGTTVAEVAYSPDWHAAGLEETKGTSLERISESGNADAPDNWTSSTDPAGGTPGRKNAVSLSPPGDLSDTGLRIQPSPFSIERDGATRIRFALADQPNLVRARIFDARGRKVRTLEDARLAGRTGELVWNGRDDAGNRVRVGVYVVLFEAVRANNETIARYKKPVVVARPLN